jgi:uncharacterized protein
VNAFYLALKPAEIVTVQSVLGAAAPAHEAFVFGSRVRRSSDQKPLKPHADLDIALRGKPLRPDAMFTLRDAFSESDLPFRVDVVMQSDLPAGWLSDIHWIQMPK